MKPRALISVSDKEGIVVFAKQLIELGYEIISTGGTYNILKQEGLQVLQVEHITNFNECLDGRVKTLHPNIHGGILCIRDNEEHMQTLENLNIKTIDIVAVNLYPFRETVSKKDHTLKEAIENIDIGGPSMIRAAAKNYEYVTIATDKKDYETIIEKIKTKQLDIDFRFKLAVKAFNHTASYDAYISQYLNNILDKDDFFDNITMTFEKKQDLRYGENPHQKASYYINSFFEQNFDGSNGIEKAVFLHGKELSYNNINDSQGAINIAREFDEIICVAVKHATPCAVSTGKSLLEAYNKSYESDPISIFGGIVCFNREVDIETAKKLNEIFLEVVIAPSYEDEALNILKTKKNIRILQLDTLKKSTDLYEYKSVAGGLLIQETDNKLFDEKDLVYSTNLKPNKKQLEDLIFAMKVVKHVKSNAIVIAKDGQTLGIGGGEVSRIFATQKALERAGDKCFGAVMASDAFFPFSDVVEICAERGIDTIIQPGGSINDKLSIDACNKFNISMVFTGMRHFKH